MLYHPTLADYTDGRTIGISLDESPEPDLKALFKAFGFRRKGKRWIIAKDEYTANVRWRLFQWLRDGRPVWQFPRYSRYTRSPRHLSQGLYSIIHCKVTLPGVTGYKEHLWYMAHTDEALCTYAARIFVTEKYGHLAEAKVTVAHKAQVATARRLIEAGDTLGEEEPFRDEEKEERAHRFLATLRGLYALQQRPTKSRIELLAHHHGFTPGEGWELAELSWLQEYYRLYSLPDPFPQRLSLMVDFWNRLQPSYAYSDSSKEQYKQYSTPGPIAAIIAEFTGMKKGILVFDPSAGTGILVLGRHGDALVNEIDASRRFVLGLQQKSHVYDFDSAKGLNNGFQKKMDVVVSNPPFASWEADEEEKERIVRQYFHDYQGITRHLRLEHAMAGIALSAMEDTGRAALLLMGHLELDERGLLRRCRPFYNWLFSHYDIADLINLNSFHLYNKQGTVIPIHLVLIRGRKTKEGGNIPLGRDFPFDLCLADSFEALWERIAPLCPPEHEQLRQQLALASQSI